MVQNRALPHNLGKSRLFGAKPVQFSLKFCKVSYDTLLYGVGIITK